MASILKAGRHVAMWSVGAGTAIPFILPTVLAEDKPVSSPCCHGEIKPSQLPIYDEPEDLYDITYHVSGKGKLQEGVEVVRKEVEDALESTKELRDRVDHIYQTGKAHTAGQIAYLREEENLPARAGAIAAGGLVGLLLGARGRIIKKLLYTSVGAGATGAVLYPEYSKLYSQDLWRNANTYAMVAYNFCVGVKPQVNGSGSGSEETAATSPVDSGKSKSLDARGMESDAKNREENSTGKGASQATEKAKDVVVRAEADKKGGGETKPEVDHGQSNPEDVDMYTTRS